MALAGGERGSGAAAAAARKAAPRCSRFLNAPPYTHTPPVILGIGGDNSDSVRSGVPCILNSMLPRPAPAAALLTPAPIPTLAHHYCTLFAQAIGTFFEGVMTQGYSTDAADDAVQANIVAAGYALL